MKEVKLMNWVVKRRVLLLLSHFSRVQLCGTP